MATVHDSATFAALLRRHRLAAGLSQEALAEGARLSVEAVSQLERGRRTAPRLETVLLLAEALDLSSERRAALLAAARPPAEAAPAAEGRAASSRPRHNLPVQRTPFIGREAEIAALRARLLDPGVHLVTLTGPGGTGKTRLALQTAATLVDELPDGVVAVFLAALADPQMVPGAIAQALDLQESPGTSLLQTVCAALRERELLVLLDNFEHLLDAGLVVSALLEGCPRLTVLVTSRAVLRLQGEYVVAVPPLALPLLEQPEPPERLTQYEAVRLFIACAQAARADFAVTNENAPAVAEVCHRLDGLPLAIELAAARTALLPPQALLERLNSRLRLLTGGARDVPARQQTLRNTIAWSYDLLRPAEQALFRRLSVFAGGCTLEAAAGVCRGGPPGEEDVFEVLASLVEKSLVRREEAAGGRPRLTMLETISEYAQEQLTRAGERDVVQQAHTTYYVALAEEAERHCRTREQGHWIARLHEENANLRAALTWAGDSAEVALALRLATALGSYWRTQARWTEGRAWLKRILAMRGAHASAGEQAPGDTNWTDALLLAGRLAGLNGALTEATALFEEALDRSRAAGDRRSTAAALADMSEVAIDQNEYGQARQLLAESLTLWREVGDTRGTADALGRLGWIASVIAADYPQAQTLLDESETLCRQQGDLEGLARVRLYQATMARCQGQFAQARLLIEEMGDLRRASGYGAVRRMLAYFLGALALDQGDVAQATLHAEESLALSREDGEVTLVVSVTWLLGLIAHERGAYTEALALLEEARKAWQAHGGPRVGYMAEHIQAITASASAVLARERGEHHRAAALHQESVALWRGMSNPWVVIVLVPAALSAQRRGAPAEAAALYAEALALLGTRIVSFHLVPCLSGVATLAVPTHPAQAAHLLGAAAALGQALFPAYMATAADSYDDEETSLTARAALGDEAFTAAWAQGEQLTLHKAIAEAQQLATALATEPPSPPTAS